MTTAFYNSRAWKDTRRNYKQSVGGLCERCLSRGIISSAEIVHHKVPLTDKTVTDLNLSLNWDNLQALCRKCHGEVHEEIYAARTHRRYKIGPDGKIFFRNEAE